VVKKPSDQAFSENEPAKADEGHHDQLKNKISELQMEALQKAETEKKDNLAFAAEFKILTEKIMKQKEIIKHLRSAHRKELEAAKKNNSADAALERKMKLAYP